MLKIFQWQNFQDISSRALKDIIVFQQTCKEKYTKHEVGQG